MLLAAASVVYRNYTSCLARAGTQSLGDPKFLNRRQPSSRIILCVLVQHHLRCRNPFLTGWTDIVPALFNRWIATKGPPTLGRGAAGHDPKLMAVIEHDDEQRLLINAF